MKRIFLIAVFAVPLAAQPATDVTLTAMLRRPDDSMRRGIRCDDGCERAGNGWRLAYVNAHNSEGYGSMAVCLRLKGFVPPSSQRPAQK
jgi:hypothetical protein